MWQQMIKLEKQKREINVLTQKVMAKKQNKQTKKHRLTLGTEYI